VDRLKSLGHNNIIDVKSSKTEIEKTIHFYDGIVIRSRFKIDKSFIDKATNLKFIARVGAGLESIDVDFAKKKGIHLISAPEGNRNAVGEHTLGMLLALLNKIRLADLSVRSGNWLRETNRGVELDGKIVGINYTAYKEQDEEFSISYAINNQIAEQVVDNYLINGIDYENIGVFGAIDNVSFYLPPGDDRNLPFYYIYDVHPGSFAEKAFIEKDELLFFFGDYYVGKSDFSDIGVDGAPMLTDLCSLISEWENSDKQNIELTLYSCYWEEFYVATLSKTNEVFDAYFIDNPFNNFSNEEIDKACYNNF